MSKTYSKTTRRAILTLVWAAGLGGCAHALIEPPEPIVKTVEVKVPVPVPCAALSRLGDDPAYSDTDGALKGAPDIFEQVRMLLMGRLERSKRLAAYAAARQACAAP